MLDRYAQFGAFLYAIRLAVLLSVFLPCALMAQTVRGSTPPGTAEEAVNDSAPAGIIPVLKGPNLSLVTASQHDSSAGWSSLLTPDFAWRFNKHFSADTSAPVYAYVLVVVTGGTKAVPVYTNETRHFVMGDTALNGHYDVEAGWLTYGLTLTLGVPTGDSHDGLGAGQATYNLNNHFEKDIGDFTPDIELGIADSSALIGTRIRKGYTSVGKLAHFQAGGSVDLPFSTSFEADAYEELPIGNETLYSTTGKGKKKVTTSTTTGAAEDNGFTSSLDIPLNPHVTLSGFYNRSLRNKIDTAGFSFTFFLRAAPREKPH